MSLTYTRTFENLDGDSYLRGRDNLLEGNSFFRSARKETLRLKDFKSHYENGIKDEEKRNDPKYRSVSMFLKAEDVKKSLEFLHEKMVSSPTVFKFVLQVCFDEKAGIITNLEENFHVDLFKSDQFELSDINLEEVYNYDRVKQICE